jgi:putative flippase GtrA
MRSLLLRLVRSGGAGAVATVADLLALTVLKEGFGIRPEVASVPALTLGTLLMFFAQKHFVFQSKGGSVARELVLFGLVQAGGYVLTLVGYAAALRFVPWLAAHYLVARLVVTNLVWVAYSFPLWHWVFRGRAVDKPLLRP